MTGTAQSMRDYWWWRPGWRVGRSFYTWHVTFDDQPAVHRLAADYAPCSTTCAVLAPFTIALGPVRVNPEALMPPVRPVEPVTWLRATIRAALIDLNRDHHIYEWTDIATADLRTTTI